MSAEPGDRRLRVRAAIALALLGLCMVVTLYTRRAEFFLDDHLIDAITRSAVDPFWFFGHRHFFTEHLHRPMGFASWWLLAAAGPGAGPQLLGNALLLAVNGTLLAWLLLRWQVPALVAGLTAALWVAHPGSVVFAGWAANRFELLATAFGLACLSAWTAFLFETRSRQAVPKAVLTAALAVAALLAKESAVVLAPLLLAMATTARPAGGVRRRLVGGTAVAVAAVLAAFVGYRGWLRVGLPQEVIDANGNFAWLAGIAKWWRHLPEFICTVSALPAALGWLMLAVLPVVVLALLLWAWRGCRSASDAPCPQWPVLIGGMLALAMPVIQVGHLSLATMAFVDPTGRMTGLFVERFYFQGGMGLLMIVAGLLAGWLRRSAGRSGRKSPAAWAMVAGALAVVAYQGHRSRETTDHWPDVTRDIVRLARAAADALDASDARSRPGCRVRFTGAPSPVFVAFAEGMIKPMIGAEPALGRCIIETETRPMISMTHASRIGDYVTPKAAAELPRVGDWYFLRPTLVGDPTVPITHGWRFDPSTGGFQAGMAH